MKRQELYHEESDCEKTKTPKKSCHNTIDRDLPSEARIVSPLTDSFDRNRLAGMTRSARTIHPNRRLSETSSLTPDVCDTPYSQKPRLTFDPNGLDRKTQHGVEPPGRWLTTSKKVLPSPNPSQPPLSPILTFNNPMLQSPIPLMPSTRPSLHSPCPFLPSPLPVHTPIHEGLPRSNRQTIVPKWMGFDELPTLPEAQSITSEIATPAPKASLTPPDSPATVNTIHSGTVAGRIMQTILEKEGKIKGGNAEDNVDNPCSSP